MCACLAPAVVGAPPDVRALLEEARRAAVYGGEPQMRVIAPAEVAAAWAPLDAGTRQWIVAEAVECAAEAPTEMARALSLRSIAVRIAAHDPDHARRLLQEATRLRVEALPGIARTLDTQAANR